MYKLIGKDPLYQWQQGRRIEVLYSRAKFVDFAKCYDTEAKRVDVREEEGVLVANIPNTLLCENGNIRFWYVDESGNAFASEVLIVFPKAKSPDYIYTEEEVLRYEFLEKRINELEREFDKLKDLVPMYAVLDEAVLDENILA